MRNKHRQALYEDLVTLAEEMHRDGLITSFQLHAGEAMVDCHARNGECITLKAVVMPTDGAPAYSLKTWATELVIMATDDSLRHLTTATRRAAARRGVVAGHAGR